MSWSDLPADLAARVTDRIKEHADLARFRSVCPSWRSASAEHAARRRVPLLLLPTEYYFHANRRLWSLADDSVTETLVPAAHGLSFLFASPRGWTLGVANDFSTTLLHLYTGASVSLPSLPPPFHDKYQKNLRDMVWDRSPDAVMVSPGKGAFFCRPGDNVGSWSPVAGCSQAAGVSSITYCGGMFYLLDGRTHQVTAVDGATFAVVTVMEPPDLTLPSRWCRPEFTLAVSSTELLLIVRTHLLYQRSSIGPEGFFKAFREDRRSPAGWSEVADIGDRAVFCTDTFAESSWNKNC